MLKKTSTVQTIHVWITKKALTKGIFEAEAAVSSSNPDMIVEICPGMTTASFCQSYYHKNEWHTTREEAVARAEAMRQNKIASLKKQLKKLEGTPFK